MKKILAVLLCVALAVVAVACVATAAPNSDSPSSLPATPEDGEPVAPDSSSTTEPDAPKLPSPTVQQDRLTVADAMMYRGNVISVDYNVPEPDATGKDTEELHQMVITLEQAKGTNYSAPTLQFAITDDTHISFPVDQLAELEGKYLEVYFTYMTRDMPNPNKIYNAIAINNYGDEGMVNFNGTVTEIVPHPDKEGEGRLLMTDLDNKDFQVYYLYSPETNFYMNFSDIKVGDKLNIFHSPAMAMSMPPQCSAITIRPYYDNTVKYPAE